MRAVSHLRLNPQRTDHPGFLLPQTAGQEIRHAPSHLLLIAALLALGFGLGFLLVPTLVLPLYEVDPAPATALMSRFFGAALLQWGVALYLVREVREPATQRGLVLPGVADSAAGLAVALMGQLAGPVNVMGWSTVAIYGVLMVSFPGLLRTRQATA